ncbi:hypothetical protein LguiA_001638 [Lonicera macranthoides]
MAYPNSPQHTNLLLSALKNPFLIHSILLQLLHLNGAIRNLQIKPVKAIPKQGLVEKSIIKSSNKEFVLKKIDSEIDETEKEIKR